MSDKEKPSVFVCGGNFRGRGAEAMMLTVAQVIRELRTKTTPLTSLRLCGEVDKLSKSNIAAVCHNLGSKPGRAVRRILRKRGWLPTSHVPLDEMPEEGLTNPFRVSKAMVDVSGFANGDQLGPVAAFHRLQQAMDAKQAGNLLVYMPQSWGPFLNPKTASYTKEMVQMADVVFAREESSCVHLCSLDPELEGKVEQATDIAFHFQASPLDKGNEILSSVGFSPDQGPVVALTPNMQMYRRCEGQGRSNEYVALMMDLVHLLLEKTDARVLLIPFESDGTHKGDRYLCGVIGQQFTDEIRVAEVGTLSAADAKSLLGCVDFLFAGRYHSLVFALSMRTPVSVLGWSHKYDDLMRMFGLEAWAFDVVRRQVPSLAPLLDAWEQRNESEQAIRENIAAVESSSAVALNRLKEVLQTAVC